MHLAGPPSNARREIAIAVVAATPEVEASIRRLAGVSAIPVTPFDDAGALDEPGLRAVVAQLVDGGVEVVVPCGNTGERAALTAGEADRVAALAIEATAGRATVLVGVGGDVRSAAADARRARERGADGVMVHFPTDPYLSDAGLVAYYEALAGASDGLVVPYLRRRRVSDHVLDAVAALPGVAAIKYALPDVLEVARLVQRHGAALQVICGLAELWAPFFWLAGARGFTSGLANIRPDLSLALLAALRDGDHDETMRVWQLLRPIEELRALHDNANNVPAIKHALAREGVIASAAVRPPLAPLSAVDAAELAAILAAWGRPG